MSRKGFTLIELLVVIAIIGILSSIVLASLNTARAKARESQSLRDLHEIKTALELYYLDNMSYPVGPTTLTALYVCGGWGGTAATNWIPGLTPNYISELPRSPNENTDCASQYFYWSNGNDYKLTWHSPENCESVKNKFPHLIDPNRDCWSYGYWTPGGVSF